MSLGYRERLIDRIVESRPALGTFVRRQPLDLTAGSWDMLSYSFQRGFETLWDQARVDRSGLLLRPLLLLWRQSVELAIKAAIREIAGGISGRPGHNLEKLFDLLIDARAAEGYVDDDDYTREVRAMVALVQSFDPFADRFRYPSSRGGAAFEGVAADLDELFQSHWMILTWCEGAALEVEEVRLAMMR